MNRTKWILCPICGNKTRFKIRDGRALLPPYQPEIFYNCEKFPQQIGRLSGQVASGRNTAYIFIAQRPGQMQGTADMETVTDNSDRNAFWNELPGKNQILTGVCGLVFFCSRSGELRSLWTAS